LERKVMLEMVHVEWLVQVQDRSTEAEVGNEKAILIEK
jgi:hypothetical protein